MGAVEDTRKALQDFLAPEIRTITAKLDALHEEQARLRAELALSEGRVTAAVDRNRVELIASESRVSAALDRLRNDLPLLVRNAVLEHMLTEKQRMIEEFQRQAH